MSGQQKMFPLKGHPSFAQKVILNPSALSGPQGRLREGGVKNLGRRVTSYLADPHPRPFVRLRWTQGDIKGAFCARPEHPYIGWRLLVLAALALVAILAGCSTGAYPVDVFPEGHYQQSYRSQEPPRLPPPTDSVPITGKELSYDFAAAGELPNPLPPTPETLARARQLYRVNCSVCHGAEGRGDGPMVAYFQQAGPSVPVDFASPRVRARKDGELYWILTNGLGLMPTFGPLLTPVDRWALVHFIRSVSGGAR